MENFDRDFNRMRKGAVIYGAFATMLSLAGIGFFVWVVIKVMAHFGVI